MMSCGDGEVVGMRVVLLQREFVWPFCTLVDI
jgi:hypothetical protein